MTAQQRKNEARERARIRREQERRKARQRRIYTYSGVIAAVIAVIIAVVFIGIATHGSNKNVRATASAAVVNAVKSVPAANLDATGVGSTQAGLQSITGKSALVASGKPEVLYLGGEFCPHCAMQRWAIAITLSRFGTLSGLDTTRSAIDDGNFATLSFLNTKYASQYITFTPVEVEDRAQKPLQKLTSAQSDLATSLLGTSSISFPFVDFGNKYLLSSDLVDDSVLSGLSAEQIAEQMSNPSTGPGKAIMGSANIMTAAVCKMTADQPSSVCSSAAVTAGATKLTTGSNGASSGS